MLEFIALNVYTIAIIAGVLAIIGGLFIIGGMIPVSNEDACITIGACIVLVNMAVLGILGINTKGETSQFSGYNAYWFIIKVEPRKIALEARIVFDGRNVSIQMIEYQTHILTQETVIDLLKQVIGVENKVK